MVLSAISWLVITANQKQNNLTEAVNKIWVEFSIFWNNFHTLMWKLKLYTFPYNFPHNYKFFSSNSFLPALNWCQNFWSAEISLHFSCCNFGLLHLYLWLRQFLPMCVYTSVLKYIFPLFFFSLWACLPKCEYSSPTA